MQYNAIEGKYMKLCTQCEKPSQFGLLVPLGTLRVCPKCLPLTLSIKPVEEFTVELRKWFNLDEEMGYPVPPTYVTNYQLIDLLIILLADPQNNPKYPRKDFIFNLVNLSKLGPTYQTQMLIFFFAWIANSEPSTNLSFIDDEPYNYFAPYVADDFDSIILFEHLQKFKKYIMDILNHHYLTDEEKAEMYERMKNRG